MPEATIAPEVRSRALTGERGPQLKTGKGRESKVDTAREAESARLHRSSRTARELSGNLRSSEAHRQMRRGRGEAAGQRNIGVDRDENGVTIHTGDRVTEGVRARAEKFHNADALVRQVVESGKGLKGLTPDQAKIVRQQVETAIKGTSHAAYFDSLGTTERTAFINEILTDPMALNMIRMRYGEVMNITLEDAVTQARLRLQTADARLKGAERRRELIRNQLDGSMKAQELLASGQDPSQTLASLEKAKPESSLEKLKGQIDAKEKTLENFRAVFFSRNNTSAQLPVEITRLTNELTELYNQRNILEQSAEQLKTLREGTKGLTERMDRLQKEAIDADEAYEIAEGEQSAAKGALTKANAERNGAEEEWLSDVTNIIKDGIAMHIDAEDDAQTQVEAEHIAQMEKEMKGQVEERMFGWERETFFVARTPTRRNKSPVEANKANTQKAMEAIFDPKRGPRKMVEAALKSNKSLTPKQREAYLNDPEFRATWEGEYVLQTLSNFVKLGGKITDDMYLYIKSQPWGGEDIIEKAVGRSSPEETKEKMKRLQELGVADKESRKKKTAGFLASILIGAFSSVISTVKSSGRSGGSSGGNDFVLS